MFDARQAYADLALEPFPFTGMDGQTYELPNLKELGSGQVVDLYDGNLFEVLEQINVEAETIAAIRAFPLGVSEKFLPAWIAHSEAKPGESPASSRSTANTARPSKPTSRGSSTSKTRKR